MKQIKLVDSFSARSYQQSLFANSLNKNTLVVLPTGLGKTIIALMLAVYQFNNSNKKILFLAPTKPLVEQQKESFESLIKNSEEFSFQVLTGLVSPKKREELYKQNDFIFSTPQLIENDLINSIIDPKKFSLVIIDEAHRGTGNYAYCFIAEQFAKSNAKLLALTASPGTSKDEIHTVMQNLFLEHIEVKRYEDPDVQSYVNKTKIEHVEVELTPEVTSLKNILDKVFQERIEKLKEFEMLKGKNTKTVTKRDLLELQQELRTHVSQGDADENIWKAISLAAGLMKLQYGQELLESQEFSAAHSYFYNFFRPGGDSSKAVQELTQDIEFRTFYEKLSKLKKEGIRHPKLLKLKELVQEELLKSKDLKIILFNQYRDTAQILVEELKKIKEIKPVLFVGQAKKGEMKLSQKEQKKVIEDFREGEFNVLVSTSVGEEGLDIPKVDLVIFYEPVPSAIRTIQRIGRTGRFNEGKAFILQTKGTRDIVTRHIANAKERRMYKALDEIQKEISGEKKQKGLTEFLNEKVEKPTAKIEGVETRIPLYVDNRENNDLIKELFRLEELKVEAKQLEVGDIVVTENIAIERKAKQDFVNSIIDKRLFPQLLDLARNYKRPILILEGKENLFSLRNLNPNVIRATLSSIAIDLRIPILVTDSMKETAQMILTIAKRTQKEKKDISLVAEKKSFSENEELEKFVSSIPKINVSSSKALLKHFKTVKSLINSTQKELEDCEGIGKVRAKFLKEFFEKEYKL